MVKVFLSYDKEDKEIAESVRDSLKNRGWSVMMPSEQVPAGASIIDNVRNSMASSTHVMSIITQNNIGSAWVNQELGYALASGKPTYLVLGNDVTASGLFSGKDYITFNERDPESAANAVSKAVDKGIISFE